MFLYVFEPAILAPPPIIGLNPTLIVYRGPISVLHKLSCPSLEIALITIPLIPADLILYRSI